MNTRLQVEHPVTELVTGLDLVELQLRIAEGHPLPPAAVHPTFAGHAIEARLYAEDPAAGYAPATGTLHHLRRRRRRRSGRRRTLRVDTGVADGSTVSPHYDSLLAKVIAHAATRAEAIDQLRGALARRGWSAPPPTAISSSASSTTRTSVGGRIHTGFLDDDSRATPIYGDVAVAALSVWFAEHAAEQVDAPVLGGMASGWRNNPAAARTIELRHAGGTIRVATARAAWVCSSTTCRSTSAPSRSTATPPAPGSAAREIVQNCTKLLVEIGSRRRRWCWRSVGSAAGDGDGRRARRYVDGHDGHVVFERLPRHPEPLAAGQAGSLTATMPGVVRRVLAAVGDRVDAGQPVVVIEAMKMEHQISAPHAGRVTVVAVVPGQQVEAGTALMEVDS